MIRRITSALSLAFCICLGVASPAGAQDPICIPNAYGVPGDGGAPDWFSYAIGDPAPVPDDARWRGAVALGRAGEQLLVRMLRRSEPTGTFLYVSIATPLGATVSPPTTAPADVRFALHDPTANRTYAAAFLFDTGPAQQTPAGGYPATFGSASHSVSTWFHDGSGWTVDSAAPAWLGGTTRSWGRCAGNFCGWVLQFRVKVGAAADAIDIGDDFRSWLYVSTPVEAASVEYTWPATVGAPSTVGEQISSAFADWQPMRRNGGPCAAGIAIDPLGIAVAHPGTAHPEDAVVRDRNQFHARPTNGMGAAVPANAVRARFRIANWGSAVGDSPEWRTIGPAGGGCADATGSGADVPASGNFDLSCDWDPTAAELCQYGIGSACAPGTQQYYPHQCVLVELEATTGADTLVFYPASAYRNMDVVGASRFEREATISLRGVAALAGTTERDVYLAAVRAAMPTVDERRAEQSREPDEGEGQGEGEGERKPRGGGDAPLAPMELRISPEVVEGIREGKMTLAEAVGRMPTLIVHVFHDTGRTVEIRSTERRVLSPQPTFGYFVEHEGPFYGWASDIEGAEEIAPDLYRVSVPNDGSVTVKTIIEAVEDLAPPPPPGAPTWVWYLLAALLLVLLLVAGVYMAERD